MQSLVAIIGRPNVGKSTFFNRLTETRKAIVDEISGVTRDRHYGKAEWNGKEFSVIDTGGYAFGSEDFFEAAIRRQVQIAIEEADLLLFLVDVTTGITDLDSTVAELIRKSGKKAFVVVNKVDNNQRILDAQEFYKLGLGEIYCISSINGSGTGDLLDDVAANITKDAIDETIGLPRIAIVGQPNVGKSSLLNVLTGTERSIVTDIAGTTRDSIHTHYKSFGKEFILVDTAGVRRKARVKEDLEFYSVMRSIRSIEESDVCLLLIDATQGLTAQDLSIFHLADRNRKGIVICVNKWDLIEKDTNSTKRFEEAIRAKLAPFNDIPILFISALEKQRIHKALETALLVYENRHKRIPGAKLNKAMLPIIEQTPPPAVKGKFIKIKYVAQLPAATPMFAFFCSNSQYLREAYRRFLENQLRLQFDFCGVPIVIVIRDKDE